MQMIYYDIHLRDKHTVIIWRADNYTFMMYKILLYLDTKQIIIMTSI